MTFIILELAAEFAGSPDVIAHVPTARQAIEWTNTMQERNPDRLYVWLLVPKVASERLADAELERRQRA